MRRALQIAIGCIAAFASLSACALGSDHPRNQPVGGTAAWPTGLKELVNTTNRVHGFFVNAEDIFFFAGDAAKFSQFLSDYSKIQGVEKHQLILHEGKGEAKSPWSKSDGKPSDWKIHACPKSWRVGDAKEKAFILEVHFWTGGALKLEEVNVPKNVEVTKKK